MHIRRSLLSGGLAGLLAASLLTPGASGATGPDPARGPAGAGGERPYQVTLVTGDRVVATGDQVAVRPAEGRDQVGFVVRRTGDHHYVIPGDAVPLLAADRLDWRLFDVALLREFGYHRRPELPLIITGEPGAAGTFAASAGAVPVRELSAVDGVAVAVGATAAAGLWESLTGPGPFAVGAGKVWLDGQRRPLLDESVPQVGAPEAHDLGLDGTGVRVAVLDTGIDADHPDLADRVVARENFVDGEEHRDPDGHGTHVAGIVAGTGAASGGRLRGVAPGAALLDAKVCGIAVCDESAIIEGMQWAAEQGATVANMSLGFSQLADDPLATAVERLTEEFGTLFVVAAGNAGPAAGTVTSPGVAGAALTVGAVDKADAIAVFSSRGPERVDGTLKPDLTAPGVGIVSANSGDGGPGLDYTTLSGTSMASPHVAGAAAILAQQHPDWDPGRIKAGLMASADPRPGQRVTDQGAGRLDVARAVAQQVTSEPASVSFARQEWPHGDDRPRTRTLTYRNPGPADLTLALAVSGHGPTGEPAPVGMFTLDASKVTVPAGGTAEVALTADTTPGDVDGYFGGWVTATGGNVGVRTPFGVDRAPESYDVTLRHQDRDGAPTTGYVTFVDNLDGGGVAISGEPEATVRLPVGDYLTTSFVIRPLPGGAFEIAILVDPRLRIDGERTITRDARDGELVTLGVPDRRAAEIYTSAQLSLALPDAPPRVHGILAPPGGLLFTGQVGATAPQPRLTTVVAAGHAVPGPAGALATSPATYHQGYVVREAFPTGLTVLPRPGDFARVRVDAAQQVPGSAGTRITAPVPAGLPAFTVVAAVPMDLPQVRTEHVLVADGLAWLSSIVEELAAGDLSTEVITLPHGPTAYPRRGLHRERWNYAVFGPDPSAVVRSGDTLEVAPVLYRDGAGHAGLASATGRISVFRDGELIARDEDLSATVDVPPEVARYRVEVEATRFGPAPLSSETRTAWEFRSGHEPDAASLPAAAVRFSPPLAPDNTAPAGGTLRVPVTVDSTGDAPVAALAVEVSFDDGATWRPVRVIGGAVVIRHPAGDGFVSLRATAADTAGNTVQQTVIRAYGIR